VVPFLDVLPNHVAPVEHLRAFGGLASIDTTPSPIYGPSRIFLGYQSLLGVVAELVEIPAVTAIGAFALPLMALLAAAGYGLARAIAGPAAGLWALILVPLSVTFLRVADARAGVVAFPLAALALWLLLDDPTVSGRRRDILLTAVLASAILVHPLIGLLACASIGVLALLRPDRYAWALPATAAAPVACLGQWAAMLGLDAPPSIALLGVPAAAGVLALAWAVRGLLARRPVGPEIVRRLPLSLVGVALIVAVLLVIVVPGAASQALAGIGGAFEWYAALLAAGGLSLVLARNRPGWELPWAAVVACMLIGAAVAFVPTGSTLRDSIRFELPKTLTYFGPTFLAVAGAIGLAAAWEARGRPAIVRAVLCGIVLVLAAAPIRSEIVHELSLGEHRLAESLSISLRNAAAGYWRGYPDQRRLIDPERAELVALLRGEIDGGRLTGRSHVLHVAQSFQPWAATPLAVFTGAIETTATLDPEVSIHTEGGRLEDVAELSTLLLQAFDYVVLEPEGLPDDPVSRITAAGFTPVFANARGSVYHRPFLQRLVEARARPPRPDALGTAGIRATIGPWPSASASCSSDSRRRC
jgi:hypothetical protein